MTDREKAIVMAYTGKCMLTGNKFQIFHEYVEEIMGRPIWIHEMGIGAIADEIKEKSRADFIALCADEKSSDKPDKWIPVSERLPDFGDLVLASTDSDYEELRVIITGYDAQEFWFNGKIKAWMPLPEP